MSVIVVVHASAAVRDSIRRAVKSRNTKVLSCRTASRINRLVRVSVVDALLVDFRVGFRETVAEFRRLYPAIPVFTLSRFRPDDGVLITQCLSLGVHILAGGVDDVVVGELVAAGSAAAQRRWQLGEGPRLLGLSEPVQVQAWEAILNRVDRPTLASEIAGAMGVSREHLSREFASGGAPNLKRVIDLVRLACAAQLLTNPGYGVADVARILHFASASHLAGSANRIAGAAPTQLADLGPQGVLQRFRHGRTRSRL